MFCNNCRLIYRNGIKRSFSSQPKPQVKPDDEVLQNLVNQVYKPRQHPGIMKPKLVNVPEQYIKAAVRIVSDYPLKAIVAESKQFSKYLRGRHPPVEEGNLKAIQQAVVERVLQKTANSQPADGASEVERLKYKQKVHNKVNNILLKSVYNWQPMKYDTYKSLVYLFSRAAPEYAVLIKIFSEIAARDPMFRPRSLFDFGSGIGTVSWAAQSFWKNHIFEYFNVDVSRDMNDLAESILRGGRNSSDPLKGVFFRQFLPSTNLNYDLVVSAYSMFELPSLESRLETALNLWNKTEHYLVLVEQGTNSGFKIINETRDFILQLDTESYVFSPCAHDDICPRFVAEDGTPCNFEVNYYTLPVVENSTILQETYSYVVIKKGKRRGSEVPWPRIVRDTLVRSKHTICRLCTPNGKLEEVIFTSAKHGKECYQCARSSKWGDLLPITLTPNKESDL